MAGLHWSPGDPLSLPSSPVPNGGDLEVDCSVPGLTDSRPLIRQHSCVIINQAEHAIEGNLAFPPD